jgi:hypothetical protein
MKRYYCVIGRGVNATVHSITNVSGEAVRNAKTLCDFGDFAWVQEVETTPGGRAIGTSVYWNPKVERYACAKE